MNSEAYYKIADIILRVTFDFVFPAQYSYMSDFLSEPCEPDYTLDFRQTDNIPSIVEKTCIFIGEVAKFHYYQDHTGKEYCLHIHDGYYHAVTILGTHRGACHYVSTEWLKDEIERGNYLENFFCIEKILMQFDAMILHSCHIQKDGRAILFTAPSGTGKSTQGDLWRVYKGATVVNGDRTIIRKTDGIWKAYGAPFCGTSNIHLNRQAPLRAIVILQQASENTVSFIPERDAFAALYRELTVNSWNDAFVQKALDWIQVLLTETPIVQFLCTKEPEATTVLDQFLKENIDYK